MIRTYIFFEKSTRRSGDAQRAKWSVITTDRIASDRAGFSYFNWMRDAFIALLLFDKIGCSLSNNIVWWESLTSESEHKVQGGLLLDVVVTQSAAIFQLFSRKNEALLIRGDAFLILNLPLNRLNIV
jgi:hypothetical protein